MELIATTRRDRAPVACAYGAVLVSEGRILRCGLLFVMKGTARTVTFRDPETKMLYRVRLPLFLTRQRRHARISRYRLEVLPS